MSDFIIENGILTKYQGRKKAPIIPDDVTTIGAKVFRGRKSLKSIVIPDSVTSIGESAFQDCTSLQSVTIPDSVTEIDKKAFKGCNQIKECVLLPNSEDEAQCKMVVSVIGTENLAYAFLSGNMTTNPIIEKLLKSKVAAKAFRTKYIPELIENQKTELFIQLLSLVKKMEPEEIDGYMDLSVEKGAVEITNRLIEYRQKLYTPEQNIRMLEESFEKEMGIREKTLADYRKEFGLNKDGDTIKSYKGKGPTVLIPGNIKGKPVKIAEKAFSNCANIQTVYIEDGVTSIGDWAFSYCTSLQSITIPESVTSIDNLAFYGCKKLTIHAPTGSCAERYAKEENIKFKAI